MHALFSSRPLLVLLSQLHPWGLEAQRKLGSVYTAASQPGGCRELLSRVLHNMVPVQGCKRLRKRNPETHTGIRVPQAQTRVGDDVSGEPQTIAFEKCGVWSRGTPPACPQWRGKHRAYCFSGEMGQHAPGNI